MANRRDFLKVLGVTGAGGAVLSSCSPGSSADRLLPYVVPDQDIVPGVSTWYRTTCRECPAGCGMNIRTREGRAIKAEGNPLSPISHGRLCPRGQASLHGLYDPDRVPQALVKAGESWDRVTWDDAENRLLAALGQHRGRTVFLTQNETGTLDRLIDDFCAAFGITRMRYEAYGWEPVREANRRLFGIDAVPVHDFAQADVVVTFGADFLETWVSPVDYHWSFIQGRAYNQGRRGRMIAVGSHQSLTGMNADEWINIRPGTEHLVALAMARLIADSAGAQAGPVAGMLQGVDVAQLAQVAGVSPERLRQAAADFANNGRSLAVGPGVSSTSRNATQLAIAVAVLNSVAGNIGRTVKLSEQETHTAGLASYREMQALMQNIANGQVTALLVHGPNPLFTMPEHDVVQRALEGLGFLGSFSYVMDETTERAHLVMPDHHFLESWGDYIPRTGVRSVIQPVMSPVFNTRQTADVLLSVAAKGQVSLPNVVPNANPQLAPTFYDYLRGAWQREVHPTAGAGMAFDDWWRDALKAGVVTTTAAAAAAPALNPSAFQQFTYDATTFDGDGEYHLLVYPSIRFYDGRSANRMWLQELPDPVSKFTWVSWVEVSSATAERLGLDTGHMARVRTATGQTEPMPVWVHPGMRDDVIAIQIGQGHETMGRYARERGVNPMRLLQPIADEVSGGLVWFQAKAALEPTGKWARPPQHGIQDDQHDRGIAQVITLNEARAKDTERGLIAGVAVQAPAPGEHEEGGHGEVHPQDARVNEMQDAGGMLPVEVDASPAGYPHPGMYWGEYTEEAPRWGMAIDLERCTGCSACVTACYAENNIAVVGPDQVAMGRIMHWIRIERYFDRTEEGELERTSFLPMLCQHCSNAPCEPVCPVFAAYHTPDGLNAQVYNRCVGTRYCSNNCPYKVRVFNWFTAEWPEPLNWQLNPDVTVREKGVMEKCTYCVQRIREAQNNARVQQRAVVDGEIVPACAQTCPGDAIVFGNVRDPNSRVSRIAASGRGYRVLEMINTQSSVTYLKRVVLEEAEA